MNNLARICLVAWMVTLAVPWTASAQVTTGSVAGTIKDAQEGVIPGATVILVSETRGTRTAPVVTNTSGDYVFANITADTYTVEVTMSGFKMLRRTGVIVSGGDRVSVGALAIEVGGASETVNVTAEAPLIQAQSGERSFAVTTSTVDNLPVSRSNFAGLAAFVPGVSGTNRLGGGGQNNFMMDGVSTMDTGNNGQLLQMNIEAIAEVKVLTSAYQAEFGRSSGLQITAVTKSGTNRFHGSIYNIRRDSDWNTNSWANQENGDPTPVSKQTDWGYSLGGPVGKPGGSNKLFFFYSHEYRPRTSGGNVSRFRLPTALERQGDFSQTRDNQGNLFNLIRDASTGLPCTTGNTAGCFQDGGVLGRIPQDRLYAPGLATLAFDGLLPLPNVEQVPGQSYNYEVGQPTNKNTTTQPAIRMDYQASPSWRFTAKYAGQLQKSVATSGSLPGFNDAQNFHPNRHTVSTTANWTINSTTFVEGSYGFGQNQLGTLFLLPASSRAENGLAALPLLYPDADIMNPDYYATGIFRDSGVPWFDDGRLLLPPQFSWGNRISGAAPNFGRPTTNINRSQDLVVSLTKVEGRHTIKGGIYWNHAYKAQNLGTAGAQPSQGALNFGNDANNPLDTGFGYANAALGIFTQYQQQSKYVEGSYIYNNIEWYLQDNWKVSSRLTLDYGLRFVYMQPTYDTLQQSSNFFLDRWQASDAPRLYVPACPGNANPCATGVRQAMDPLTGVSLGPNSSLAIGQIVPNSGNITNGILQAGDGISKYNYTWPTVVVAPRFGMAYDLSGNQTLVLRAGLGLFHDRPAGDTMYSQVGNPPFSTSKSVRYAHLQGIESGLTTQGPPQLTSIWPYETDIPSSTQWNLGMQMAMPWSSSLDVSYVGQRGINRLFDDRGQTQVDINAPDFGAAFLDENQDPTLAANSTPGATALSTDLLRPYRGFGLIGLNLPRYWDAYHSVQTSFNRRFQNGLSFGLNYTIGLATTGNRGLQTRLDHGADGSYSVRPDQAEYEDLNRDNDNRRHLIKGNFVWDLPDLATDGTIVRRVAAAALNDWQVSSVVTAGSGPRYNAGFSYQNGGQNQNLTGSPSYPARIVIAGDTGSGCSDDQYSQFNAGAFRGPVAPSLGLESGRNYLGGCFDQTVDLALTRLVRLGGGRSLQFRLDAFNAFNVVVFNGRVTTLQMNSQTDQVPRNSQFLADGSVDPTKMLPKNAGFGAVTGAQAMRTVQAQVRFAF